MRSPTQLLSIGSSQSPFQGVMNIIAPENLPPYVFQKLINYEIAHEIGTLKKRPGYEEIITGETTLAEMLEWIDKNGGRQLFIQKGTTIRESVYSGGAYGALAAFTNDERTAGSTTYRVYPVFYEKKIRTGAGINAATDLPMIAYYTDARSRFPNATAAAIPAGKYLSDQFMNDSVGEILFPNSINPHTILKTGETGPGAGTYLLYYAPVIDGYQLGFPRNDFAAISEFTVTLAAGESFDVYLDVLAADKLKEKRITAIDVFVAQISTSPEATKLYDSYFLERIPLEDDGDDIFTLSGTFENANPPTYIDFATNTDWETFDMEGFHIKLTYSAVDYVYLLGGRSYPGGAVTRFAITSGAAALQNITEDCTVFSRWFDFSTWHRYRFAYDSFYRSLGSEMFTHRNIPSGDKCLDDLKYKYACEANKRYFIFGRDDGFGYFSVPGSPDIMPSLNIIRPRYEPTGCVGVDKDVFLFSKFQTSRISILTNTQQSQDDDLLDYGCTNHESIVKLSDYVVAWMSYKGPVMAIGRQTHFIGEPLFKWWNETLSAAEMAACVAGYNYLKDQIWFCFPTYTDTDFPNGIIFVFDRKAFRRQFISPWFYFSADTEVLMKTISDDGHLLTASLTEIVDWNGTPDETVNTLVKLLIMKNPRFGKRAGISYKKVFVDYVSDDTPTARIYLDGSGTPVNLTLDADYESFINYIAETLELEIITSASANSVDIKGIQLEFRPKGF